MKKIIIFCSLVFTLCLSQSAVGIFAKQGESGSGVDINASILNIEYDDADPSASISYSNISEDGVEWGLSYELENGIEGLDFNPITLSLIKHYKNDEGLSKAVGLAFYNITEAEAEDYYYYYETDMQFILGAGVYTNDKAYFRILYNLDAEDDATTITLGKYSDMGGLFFGIEYYANLSYLDEGWIGITTGTNF